ncbi:response regulator [soil metagenome]
MSKRKLLLADDSITIQKVVNLTFADEGIEVITAGDGDAAMQKFVEIKPDLVMVDVNMPGMDGYRICELIKQDAETKHIPVILMVGSFEPFDEEEARRVGADDFLTKPFQSIRQLVNKVSLLLDVKAGETSGNRAVSAAENENAEPENQTFEPPTVGSFGDVGLDDDMIQTNQIGSLPINDEQKFESSSDVDKPFFDLPQMPLRKPYEFNVETPDEEDALKTRPLTTTEFDKITSNSANADTEKTSVSADRPSFSKRYIIEEPKVSEEKPAKSQTFSESPFASAPIEEEQETYPASRPTELLNFDDFNLLELPMFEDEEVSSGIEQETPADFDEQLSEPIPEIPEFLSKMQETSEITSETTPEISEPIKISEETPATMPESVEISQASPVSETEENSAQALNFTPDLIEAIANKVAEKISVRAIREIASEVKPERVELIIKRMAEEKMKE